MPQCRARGRSVLPAVSLPARLPAAPLTTLFPALCPRPFFVAAPRNLLKYPAASRQLAFVRPRFLYYLHPDVSFFKVRAYSARHDPGSPVRLKRAACTLLVGVICLVLDGPLVHPTCLRCWGCAVATRVLKILAVAQSATFPTLRSTASLC